MSVRITSVRPVYKGWAAVSVATVERNGAMFERLVEDHGAAVCAFPVDRRRKVAMMVRQLRIPVAVTSGATELLECPAGLIDRKEEPGHAIGRELLEETGLQSVDIRHIASAWTMPGISTERMHLFLASYCATDRKGKGGGHASEHENITIEEVPLSELAAMADDGRLVDLKSLFLIQTLRLSEPELFR